MSEEKSDRKLNTNIIPSHLRGHIHPSTAHAQKQREDLVTDAHTPSRQGHRGRS